MLSAQTKADYMARHRAHDYAELVRRWQTLSLRFGLRMECYARFGGQEVWVVGTAAEENAIYLSAGMHGDEPAPPWALLEWAEVRLAQQPQLPLLVFPCLNPWGLINNTRMDHRGRDINRLFQSARSEGILQWRKAVGHRRFRLALNLHEDYDAQGMYVYELNQSGEHLAERALDAASAVIAPDRRSDIDGSEAHDGVIRREVTPDSFPLPGLPEAVYLHFHHADATLTIESPSEFALYDRIEAHKRCLQALLG